MIAKTGSATSSLERLNALFAWWGVPTWNGTGDFEAQMKRLQAFAVDLQRIYGDAYGPQMEVLCSANARLTHAFKELAQCRRPLDLIVAEAGILAALLGGASAQAKTWAALAQKVEDRCAVMMRETAAEFDGHDDATAPSSAPEGRRTRQTTTEPAPV